MGSVTSRASASQPRLTPPPLHLSGAYLRVGPWEVGPPWFPYLSRHVVCFSAALSDATTWRCPRHDRPPHTCSPLRSLSLSHTLTELGG